MKKKRLLWSFSCSIAAVLSLALVAAPASASSMMPSNLEKTVGVDQERYNQLEAQRKAIDDARQVQTEQMAKEREERVAANTVEAALARIEAEKKASEDAREAKKQALMERAGTALESQQLMFNRENLQRPNSAPQPTPKTVVNR